MATMSVEESAGTMSVAEACSMSGYLVKAKRLTNGKPSMLKTFTSNQTLRWFRITKFVESAESFDAACGWECLALCYAKADHSKPTDFICLKDVSRVTSVTPTSFVVEHWKRSFMLSASCSADLAKWMRAIEMATKLATAAKKEKASARLRRNRPLDKANDRANERQRACDRERKDCDRAACHTGDRDGADRCDRACDREARDADRCDRARARHSRSLSPLRCDSHAGTDPDVGTPRARIRSGDRRTATPTEDGSSPPRRVYSAPRSSSRSARARRGSSETSEDECESKPTYASPRDRKRLESSPRAASLGALGGEIATAAESKRDTSPLGRDARALDYSPRSRSSSTEVNGALSRADYGDLEDELDDILLDSDNRAVRRPLDERATPRRDRSERTGPRRSPESPNSRQTADRDASGREPLHSRNGAADASGARVSRRAKRVIAVRPSTALDAAPKRDAEPAVPAAVPAVAPAPRPKKLKGRVVIRAKRAPATVRDVDDDDDDDRARDGRVSRDDRPHSPAPDEPQRRAPTADDADAREPAVDPRGWNSDDDHIMQALAAPADVPKKHRRRKHTTPATPPHPTTA